MDRQYPLRQKLVFKIFVFAIIMTTFMTTLTKVIADEGDEFLSPDKAFILEARLVDKTTIELHFSIAPGYLLYRQYFAFHNLKREPLFLETQFPKALAKYDAVLNEDYEAYANQVTLSIPLPNQAPGFTVTYQGCSESGFCYAPITKQINVLANGKVNITDPMTEISNADRDPHKNLLLGSNADRIYEQLKTGTFPVTLLLFLGFGILLAFTPCILPMVPILANILVGEDTPLSSRRATLLASLYVLSVAICYACAGVIAGVMGAQLQIVLQKPIFILSLSFILLLFALNQFNLFHIHLPQLFTQKLHQLQHKQKQGSITGAIVMGVISALIVSPCVTPALVGALTYIGQTGNALLGGFALFAMAIGMGLPLLITACIGSHFLPKSGRWMGYIKIITGIFLLILAGSLLLRIFPQALNTFRSEKTLNLSHHFIHIQNEKELKTALNDTKAFKKIAILDVYADWCIACRQLDRELFEDTEVLSRLQNVTLLRLDITKLTTANETLQKNLQIIGPPTLLFFDKTGKESKDYRLVGKIESNNFLQHIQHFLKSQYK